MAKISKASKATQAIFLLALFAFALPVSAQGNAAPAGNAGTGAAANANTADESADEVKRVRLKDIVTYAGTGRISVNGTGLVYGLDATGDDSDELAQEMDLAVNRRNLGDYKMKNPKLFASKNISRVTFQGHLTEATTVEGTRFEIQVMALGNTTSLKGGVLLVSDIGFIPRKEGAERRVVGEASGPLRVSGEEDSSPKVAEVTAQLNVNISMPFFSVTYDDDGAEKRMFTLGLVRADSATATNIARAINDDREIIGAMPGVAEEDQNEIGLIAKANGASRVDVEIPRAYWGDETSFRALIDQISVITDSVQEVRIDTRSNTIHVSDGVIVLPGKVSIDGVVVDVGNGTASKLADLLGAMSQINLTAAQQVKVIQELDKAKRIQARVLVDDEKS